MTYSAEKHWTIVGGALALGVAGVALVTWLTRNHVDPVSVGLLQVAVAWIGIALGMWAHSYSDEVERQIGQKQWCWGCMIGIAAMVPAVVFLQTHKAWLDAAVQFVFRHAATPSLYFGLGVVITVLFQLASVLVLDLLDKLSRGSQS